MRAKGGYIIIPKQLIAQREKLGLSLEAIFLYALLVDRYKLSAKNAVIDKDGNVYVIFSREEAAERLGISLRKCSGVFSQLIRTGLIHEKVRGRGLAHLIYLSCANIADDDFYGGDGTEFACHDKQNKAPLDEQFLPTNNTDNNILKNNNYLTSVSLSDACAIDGKLNKILDNCNFAVLSEPIAELLRKTIRRMYYCKELKNGKEILPQSEIRYILSGLNTDHLIETAQRLYDNKKEITNLSAFIMSMLINIITSDDVAHLIERPPELLRNDIFFNV